MPVGSEQVLTLPKTKVLLIDDDEVQFHLVSELLQEKNDQFDLHWLSSLGLGIEFLSKNKVDVILLDLFLGDSRGLDSFVRIKSHSKDTPIVILSGLQDEKSAVEAIQQGAQDFLVKDHVDTNRLSRVIQFAMKRHEIRADVKKAYLYDALTGFYNKEGFMMMAEQYLKGVQRTKLGFYVCFAIVNELDSIKEIYGEGESSRALLTAADILRESFRSTDLIARLGHDEFAILTSEQGQYSPAIISSRIRKNQKFYDAQFNRYRLSLSMCATHFAPAEKISSKDLLSKAEKVFTDYKSKKNTGGFIVSN